MSASLHRGRYERPLLEKLSWIAGIISAGVAVFLWLKPIGEPVAARDDIQPLAVPAPTNKLLLPASDVGTVSGAQTMMYRWSCDGVAPDLQPALDSAKNISYTAPRDQALLSIARKALCIEDYAMFENAAQQISHTAPKDQAHSDAVDFTLGVRRFELAEKYAKGISYTQPRDAAMARIVAKSSVR